MSKRVKQAGVALVVVFAIAQLIRPERTNPAIDASRTMQAQVGMANRLVPVLDRACGDCHSNETVWPWYTQVAPLSWALAAGVREGRRVVNLSEWGAYSPERQREILIASCEDVSKDRMPGRPWTLLHPEARLSAEDIETICAAAHHPEALAAGRR